MNSKNINVSEVQYFIHRKLPSLIQKDLQNLNMVKEADLECCTYFHLRNYLKPDSLWKIFARKYTPTEHFIDLLLFKRGRPRISLELKWNKGYIGNKDIESLKKSLIMLRVNRAYFVSTVIRGVGSEKEKVGTKTIERYNIKGIFIPLGIQNNDHKKWLKNRSNFMSKMTHGKAKHKNNNLTNEMLESKGTMRS